VVSSGGGTPGSVRSEADVLTPRQGRAT
jgi:hypothetical protein